MTKKNRVKKINQAKRMKIFMASSIATIVLNFGTLDILSQPIIVHADTNPTEIRSNVKEPLLPVVQMAGAYQDNSDGTAAEAKQIKVPGSFQAGDLAQILLNGSAYVGVVPQDTANGFTMKIFITSNDITQLDVIVEGVIYPNLSVN
ncbi:MAG: hypothetical protein LBT37_02640 [Lactobacillaceae bacterium]|jgi:hypothetical protein|nr:hypothetical protein [Lactobacillaceae bacterium]